MHYHFKKIRKRKKFTLNQLEDPNQNNSWNQVFVVPTNTFSLKPIY